MSNRSKHTFATICNSLLALEQSGDPSIDQTIVADLKHIVQQRLAELERAQPRPKGDSVNYETA